MLHCGYKTWLCLAWGTQPLAFWGGLACLALACTSSSGAWVMAFALPAAVLLAYSQMADLRSCTAAFLIGDLPCLLPFRRAPRDRDELFAMLKSVELSPCKQQLLPQSNKPRVAVVGSGWAHWSWRQAHPSRPVVYTHRLVGIDHKYDKQLPCDQYFVFYAGTTIRQANKLMARSNNGDSMCGCFRSRKDKLLERAGQTSTFWSHPSISTISLGGWLMCSGHGNGAQAGEPSSWGLCFAEFVDLCSADLASSIFCDSDALAQGCREWNDVPSVYAQVRKYADQLQYAGKMMLISVGFRKTAIRSIPNGQLLQQAKKDMERRGLQTLAPNTLVQKQLQLVHVSHHHAADQLHMLHQCRAWLENDAVLRVLFIGSARPGVALGIRWIEFNPKSKWPQHCRLWPPSYTDHIDEHDCSRDCRAMQADTCSIVGGCYETKPAAWTGVSTLSDANMFTPFYLPPLVGAAVAWLGFYNFEVVCRVQNDNLTEGIVCCLLQALSEWHRSACGPGSSGFGRTELRCCSGDGNFLWIDFAVTRASFKDAFRVLSRSLCIEAMALHTGKYCGNALLDAHKLARGSCGNLPELSTPFSVFWSAKPTTTSRVERATKPLCVSRV